MNFVNSSRTVVFPIVCKANEMIYYHGTNYSLERK